LEIDMTSVATILIVAYIVALAALFTWLLRRKAKAASTYRKRAAVVAKLREQADAGSPIVGWMVRDVPARPKSARRARGPH
jgi:hypothetical protein